MNADLLPFQGALSASVDRSSVVALPDAEQAEGLSALWKSIFERARPIQSSRDEASLSAAGEHALRSHVAPNGAMHNPMLLHGQPDHELAPSVGTHDVHAPPIQSTVATVVSSSVRPSPAMHAPSDAMRVGGLLRTDQYEATLGTAMTIAAQPAEPPVVADTSISTGEEPRAAAVLPASAESFDAESVNVFVAGTAVAIIVRDAAPTEHEVVRAAFETARRLTGQSSALRQLILNGRTIYRQPDPSSGRLQSATLVFAC